MRTLVDFGHHSHRGRRKRRRRDGLCRLPVGTTGRRTFERRLQCGRLQTRRQRRPRQRPQDDRHLQLDVARVEGGLQLVDVAEGAPGTHTVGDLQCEVVRAEDHVLGGHGDRPPGRGRKDVVGREHEDPGLGLGLRRQGQVDGHLVAVEVGVEGGAHEWVHLNGLTLDQDRLEGLDPEAVQRRRAVQQHRVLADDTLQDVPHLRAATLDHALGRLDVLSQLRVDQPLHDERLEELEGHQLGQAALVQLEVRADHDDRTARVVDALAEQVLAEPALLALQHVRQGLQGTVARTSHRAAAPAVVEQGVDGLLEHALLVVDDDLGRAEVQQPLQAVVAIDHPPVQIVQVRGREAATVELHHGAQVRRDHRHGLEDHGAGVVDAPAVVVAPVEGGDDLQPLDRLLPPLRRQGTTAVLGVDHVAQLDLFGVEVDAVDELEDVLGAHAALEVLVVTQPQLAPEHLVFDDLATVQAPELVERTLGDLDVLLGPLTGGLDLLLNGALTSLDFGVARALLLECLELVLQSLEAAVDVEVALLLDVRDLLGHLVLERRQVLVALLLVDPGDEVGGEVDDLLELLGLELLAGLGAHEQVRQPRTGAAQVPDVHDRRRQLDVAHAVSPDLGPRDLDATPLANDALEPDALVLAAVALPVLGRAEDLLAEEAVLLRAQRAVVDRLWLLDFAVGPAADRVARGEPDAELIEGVDVQSH